jgi:FkbM family methyltransferase
MFLEMGAGDGISASNSYYLEKALGWTGVLIEANPSYHPLLAKNRPKCRCIQACVSDKREHVEFVDHGGLSGIRSQLSVQHSEELRGATHITLETQTLQSILDQYGVNHIDYFSLDVEGNELSVLRSIDFSKSHITLIGVEVNQQDYDRNFEPIAALLRLNGYRLIEQIEVDYFFYKQTI